MNYTDIQNDEQMLVFQELVQGASGEVVGLLKSASLSEDYDDLIKEAFADPENRAFPISSLPDTIISAIYLNSQDEVDPLVKEACNKALEEWGVPEGTLRVEEKLEKTASDENVPYLLADRKKLPVVDEETLFKSAGILQEHFSSLEELEKIESVRALEKLAMAHTGNTADDMMTDEMAAYTLAGSCDLNKLAIAVHERTAVVKEEDLPGYELFLQKLSQAKEETGVMVSTDNPTNIGMLNELLELDKQAGIRDEFNPNSDVFNKRCSLNEEDCLNKLASANIDTMNIGGYDIELQKLARIDESVAAVILPEALHHTIVDGAIDLDKLAQAMEELPESATLAIGQILAEA